MSRRRGLGRIDHLAFGAGEGNLVTQVERLGLGRRQSLAGGERRGADARQLARVRHDAAVGLRGEGLACEGVGIDRKTVAAGGKALGFDWLHRFRLRQHRFDDGRPRAVKAVLRPIHFAHARVEHGQHLGRPGARAAGLGHRFERDEGQHRQVEPEGEPLGHAAGRTHARERAWAGAEGDRVDLVQPDAAFGQQFLHHRQKRLRMGANAARFARNDGVAPGVAGQQRARGEFGGSFDGKDDRHALF